MTEGRTAVRPYQLKPYDSAEAGFDMVRRGPIIQGRYSAARRAAASGAWEGRMAHSGNPYPLDSGAVAADEEREREEQRRLVEQAVQQRRAALARLSGILDDAKLVRTLHHFQQERLGEYSRIMRYFGTTQQYDPRHPMAGDYALYLELQWSDEPIDFGAEDTPPGCFTISMHINTGEDEPDSIAFPSVYQRCTRDDWQRDANVLKRAIQMAYDHAMHSRKRTTRAYRFPWGIQTIYDIEML
jgi:hypothetical protein